jgi:hypothetical protein
MARRTPVPLQAAEIATLDPVRVERLRRLAVLLDNRSHSGAVFASGSGIVGLGAARRPGGGAFSLYILLEAARMGVPRALLARMGWNLGVDVLVGFVPLLGDLFDAGFKANMRNLALLDRHLERPAESRRSSRRFVAVTAILLALCLADAVALTVWLIHLLTRRSQKPPAPSPRHRDLRERPRPPRFYRVPWAAGHKQGSFGRSCSRADPRWHSPRCTMP